MKSAVQASDKALSSIPKAEAVSQELIEIWDRHKNKRQVKEMIERKQPEPPGPMTIVFLNLFWHPKESSERLGKYCMTWFGPLIVERAVSRVIKDSQEKFIVLSRFSPESFEHLRPTKAENTKFSTGDRVIVQGLKKKPELNGKGGKVTKWVPKTKRYAVRLDGRAQPVAFLPSNLRIESAGKSKNLPALDSSRSSDESSSSSGAFRMATTKSDSDDSDSNKPPALNDRDQSSSDDDSSSSGSVLPPRDELPHLSARNQSSSEDETSSNASVPELMNRGNRSSSSSSEDDSSLSTNESSGPPPLRNQASSSDDTDDDTPRRAQRDRLQPQNRSRGGRKRNGKSGRGTGRGSRRG